MTEAGGHLGEGAARGAVDVAGAGQRVHFHYCVLDAACGVTGGGCRRGDNALLPIALAHGSFGGFIVGGDIDACIGMKLQLAVDDLVEQLDGAFVDALHVVRAADVNAYGVRREGGTAFVNALLERGQWSEELMQLDLRPRVEVQPRPQQGTAGIAPGHEVEALLEERLHPFVVEYLAVEEAVREARQEQIARTGTGSRNAFPECCVTQLEVTLGIGLKEIFEAARHTPLRSPHGKDLATDVRRDGRCGSGCAHTVS